MAITIVEQFQVSYAQDFDRPAQLFATDLPQPGPRLFGVEVGIVYLPLLATRGRDEHGVHSPVAVQEQRAPGKNHLVVRVGVDGHDRVVFVKQVGSPCARRHNVMPLVYHKIGVRGEGLGPVVIK